LAAVAAVVLRVLGAIASATPAPVPGGAIRVGAGSIALMAVLAALIAGAFLLWARGAADTGPAAAPVVVLVLGLVALALWVANPFAAALIVPALHLWMWAVGPRRSVSALLVLAGLAVPVAAVFYYAHSLGLGPLAAAWSIVLLVAGGGVGVGAVVAASLVLGCLATLVAAAAIGAAREARPEVLPVTVRGPVTYAGPGSLGGTRSALRR
jgi:hypothetical protein